jgi:cyclohexanecarboxylate-CoA ligase
MVGPPTFFHGLMGASTFSPTRVASLRLVSSGGAGVTPAFVDDASAALGCVVKRSYGSTEVPTVTTSYAGDPPDKARTTDGRAVGAAELRLAPTGELEVRGPEMFVGYVDAAQTAQAMTPDGWFRTGDLATLDDGWLTITGRLKDIVIRGGENIATAEVEAVLEAHPAVSQAVVVGEPDERLGERVAAFVVGTLDLDECRRWFAQRGMARFKWPERVVVVDTVPVLGSGKPDRTALRARLRAWSA